MRIHRRMSKYLKAANQTHKLFFFFLDKCVFIKPLNASSGFFGFFCLFCFGFFYYGISDNDANKTLSSLLTPNAGQYMR